MPTDPRDARDVESALDRLDRIHPDATREFRYSRRPWSREEADSVARIEAALARLRADRERDDVDLPPIGYGDDRDRITADLLAAREAIVEEVAETLLRLCDRIVAVLARVDRSRPARAVRRLRLHRRARRAERRFQATRRKALRGR